MDSSLEALLSRKPPGDADARARALAAVRAELARPSSGRRWRVDAARVFAAPTVLSLAVAGVLWALGVTSGEVLWTHAPVLLALWATSAACGWAAIAPPRTRGRGWLAGWALALGGATLLVLSRESAPTVSSVPEWVCTLSHLGVGLLPAGVTLAALRGAAFQPGRALLGGLSVGTAGAVVGELVCAQGRLHVLLYHLSAWALAAVATLVVSRFLSPRSFSP